MRLRQRRGRAPAFSNCSSIVRAAKANQPPSPIDRECPHGLVRSNCCNCYFFPPVAERIGEALSAPSARRSRRSHPHRRTCKGFEHALSAIKSGLLVGLQPDQCWGVAFPRTTNQSRVRVTYRLYRRYINAGTTARGVVRASHDRHCQILLPSTASVEYGICRVSQKLRILSRFRVFHIS